MPECLCELQSCSWAWLPHSLRPIPEILSRHHTPLSCATQRFKDSVTFPVVARSVCSDVEYGIRDNGSVDGSASVMGESLDG